MNYAGKFLNHRFSVSAGDISSALTDAITQAQQISTYEQWINGEQGEVSVESETGEIRSVSNANLRPVRLVILPNGDLDTVDFFSPLPGGVSVPTDSEKDDLSDELTRDFLRVKRGEEDYPAWVYSSGRWSNGKKV